MFILVAPQNAVGNCIIDVSDIIRFCRLCLIGKWNCLIKDEAL